jgi:hypothetical protein
MRGKMNRRNFFKTVTGFIAGVCAACVPKAKAKLRDFDAHLVLGDDFDEVDLLETKTHPSCYGHFRSYGVLDCSVDCEFTEECSQLGQVPEYSSSASMSGHPSATNSVEAEGNFVYGWMDDWDGKIICHSCSTKDCGVRDYACKITNYPEHNIHDKLVAYCGWHFLYGKWKK